MIVCRQDDMAMMSDLAQNLPTSSCHLVRNGQFRERFRSKTFQAPEALASRGLPLSLPRNFMPAFKIILHWTNNFQKSIQTQGSLHLGQDLLIGNRFPALIFSDHLPHKKNIRILQQHGYTVCPILQTGSFLSRDGL